MLPKRKNTFVPTSTPNLPIRLRMRVKNLFFTILMLFTVSAKSSYLCQDLEWLKDYGGKEKLLLLQTQVTALKLASLIDLYENPHSDEEKEKALDFLAGLASPLGETHPIIGQFEKGPYLDKLMGIVEETRRSLHSGSLTISYQNMPSLLMVYEMSSKSGVFGKADFAVANFWQEKNPNDSLLNPILEQLVLIYHDMNRLEREALYNELNETLKTRWSELQNLALNSQCLITEEELFGVCQIGPDKLLEEIRGPFEDLSLQMTDIFSFQLNQSMSEVNFGNLEWKLHPPPKPDEIESFPSSGPKEINGVTYTEYRSQKSWYEEITSEGNLGLIKTYRELNESGPYLVLDKEKNRLFLYEEEGTLKGSIGTGLEVIWDTRADRAMEQNSGAGAGIYELTKLKGDVLELIDQRQRSSFIETENFGVDCSQGACSEILAGLDDLLKRHNMRPPLPLYILPLDEQFEFVIKNDQLSFTTYSRGLEYFNYNFTPRKEKAFPTKFKIKNSDYDTPFTREFLKALEDEKENLMKLYNLDNDEFNELSLLAFGILGQESQFGEHWRYRVKENFPGGVAYLKNYKNIFEEFGENRQKTGFWSAVGSMIKDSWKNEVDYLTGDISTQQNSRGPTQIKDVPDAIEKKYGIKKEDLHEPRKAAIATLGFLAQSLEELKAKEKFHPAINGRNRFDYLHYIYMGRSSEITRGTATPERNIYYRNIRSFSKSLEVWQDLTNS